MVCGKCGYTERGTGGKCPRCGHEISYEEGQAQARVRLDIALDLKRTLFYAAVLFGALRGGAHLLSLYLSEEHSRLDAVLLGQRLEKRKLAQEAALHVEPGGADPHDDLLR